MNSDPTNHTPHVWNIIDEELVSSTRIADMYKRHCRHPIDEKKEGDFYVLKCPDWALILALTKNQEIIVIKQYRFAAHDLFWEVPGGTIDKGESPLDAAVRELREETGYSGKNAKVIGSCRPNPAMLSNTAHFILIEDCEKTHDIDWDHHEEIEIHTTPLDEVYEWIRTGKFQHGVPIAALMYLKLYLENKKE